MPAFLSWKYTDDSAKNTALRTSTPTPVPGTAKIANPATCSDFVLGTASDLTQVLYGVKGGKISNAAPGVLFYYTHVTAPVASFTILIDQANNNGAFPLFATHNAQVNFYNGADCSNATVLGDLSCGRRLVGLG